MNQILRYSLAGVFYILAQVLLFNHLSVFQVATPFIFLLFLFTLPFEIPPSWVFVIAFFTGLTIDFASDTYANGLHAFSSVMAVSIRRRVALLAGSMNFRSPEDINFHGQNMTWFAVYLIPLILLHHLSYFFLEAFSMQHFWFTLLKVLASGIYTFVLSWILCFILYKR